MLENSIIDLIEKSDSKFCIVINKNGKYVSTRDFHSLESVIEMLDVLPSNTFIRIWKVKKCK